MANTPLTVDTATQAGQVAAQIQQLESVIAALQQAIASGAPIYSMSCALQGIPQPFVSNLVLDADSTSAILNAVLSSCQTLLTNLNTQLATF